MYFPSRTWLENGPRPSCGRWGGGLRGLGFTDQEISDSIFLNPSCLQGAGPLQPGQVYCSTGTTSGPGAPAPIVDDGGLVGPATTSTDWSKILIPVGIGASVLLAVKLFGSGR